MSGRGLPLPAARVREVALAVLAGERREAELSITFLGREAMRRLNLRYKGHDRPTDVLAFALPTPEHQLLGDVYVCPWVARREAKARAIPVEQEIVRLVVHGTLHVLGQDHPDDAGRTDSPMWRRQERYVRGLT